MNDKRNLRIFCPTHEAAFETAENPKILCEITGHALSVGFPDSEYWEFCCNCETFTPSLLDKGAKARKTCYGCGSEIVKRFACANCRVVAFESSELTKGKSYSISQNGIEPRCPGCQTVLQIGTMVLHQCKEIEAEIFTSRQDCPFCLEQTSGSNLPIESPPTDSVLFCSQCHAKNPLTAIFCGKCKHQFRTDAGVTNFGSDIYKTQLLGSLCPNCNTPIPPDSDFCGECGQAVKKAIPPPPPPPKKNVSGDLTADFQNVPVTDSTSNTNMRNIALGVGGVFLLIIILSVVSSVSKSSGGSTTNTNSTSATTVNNRSNNKGSNVENNFSVIGRYGYITINVNMRSGPDRRYDDIGTLFQNTKVKVLDFRKREDTSDWWEVEVENPSDYGCSSVDSSRCGKDESYDATRGWINSKFVVFR